MDADAWLERWLPRLAARTDRLPVLELGCGDGRDTQVLCDAGLRVVAFDRSQEQLEQARRRAPRAEFHEQDVRAPFPLDIRVNVVVASLSLHYFPWDETLRLAQRIHAALAPGGLLLCRLNSTRDHHFGATGHPLLEPGYFLVDGQPKRFFDRAAVLALFGAGWDVQHLEERVVHRYALPKVLWEVLAETRRPCGADH